MKILLWVGLRLSNQRYRGEQGWRKGKQEIERALKRSRSERTELEAMISRRGTPCDKLNGISNMESLNAPDPWLHPV